MDNTDKSLLDAHRDSLLGYLIRMTGSTEQAEDLFQETFRRVHEKAHTLRGGRFKSWLFTIATRVAIDGMRRDKRMRVISLDRQAGCGDDDCPQFGAIAAVDNSSDPGEQAIKAEQAQRVQQVIKLLPTKQRATLVLAYYQGLSYREVGQVMNCSTGTVKRQMYRALRTLAQRLPDVSKGTE